MKFCIKITKKECNLFVSVGCLGNTILNPFLCHLFHKPKYWDIVSFILQEASLYFFLRIYYLPLCKVISVQFCLEICELSKLEHVTEIAILVLIS